MSEYTFMHVFEEVWSTGKANEHLGLLRTFVTKSLGLATKAPDLYPLMIIHFASMLPIYTGIPPGVSKSLLTDIYASYLEPLCRLVPRACESRRASCRATGLYGALS